MFGNLLKIIKHFLNIFLNWLNPNRKQPRGIVGEAEDALREWKYARDAIDYADNEMLDYAIHNLNAAEKRFIGLLLKARDAGLSAWPLEEELKQEKAV